MSKRERGIGDSVAEGGDESELQHGWLELK